jgi:catechol 2,3-dioxygenase-like lactoylglutathione lyase family enzyme
MRPIRIDHVSLNAGDRARSIDWYGQAIGLEPTSSHSNPDEPIFLGHDGAQIALFADRAPGLRHIALYTDAGGYDDVLQRLEGLAVPREVVPHRTHRSIYFRDPDGHTIEVMTDP